jgi:hypothetical protein
MKTGVRCCFEGVGGRCVKVGSEKLAMFLEVLLFEKHGIFLYGRQNLMDQLDFSNRSCYR